MAPSGRLRRFAREFLRHQPSFWTGANMHRIETSGKLLRLRYASSCSPSPRSRYHPNKVRRHERLLDTGRDFSGGNLTTNWIGLLARAASMDTTQRHLRA